MASVTPVQLVSIFTIRHARFYRTQVLYIAGLKIAQLDSAASAQGPSSPTVLPAPLVNDAGGESDPITIVMLLDELLLAVLLFVYIELIVAQDMNFWLPKRPHQFPLRSYTAGGAWLLLSRRSLRGNRW